MKQIGFQHIKRISRNSYITLSVTLDMAQEQTMTISQIAEKLKVSENTILRLWVHENTEAPPEEKKETDANSNADYKSSSLKKFEIQNGNSVEEEFDKIFQFLKKQLEEKDRQISEKNTQIKAIHNYLEQVHELLESREMHVASLNQELTEAHHRISEFSHRSFWKRFTDLFILLPST